MTSGSAAARIATLGELLIIGCTSRFFDRVARPFLDLTQTAAHARQSASGEVKLSNCQMGVIQASQ
jgi:hypothetical protein